jgi:DNA-binding transcriptional LysR family regulator
VSTILRGKADFGLNYIGSQDKQLDFQPLKRECFVLACLKGHPLARKRKVHWSELAGHDNMYVTKASANRLLLDGALSAQPVRPRWFYEAQHVSTLVDFVEAGLGIAAVPELAMPCGEHPTLVSVPLVEPVVTRTIGLIRRAGRSLSPAAQHLYDEFWRLHDASVAQAPAPSSAGTSTPGRKPPSRRRAT